MNQIGEGLIVGATSPSITTLSGEDSATCALDQAEGLVMNVTIRRSDR